MKFTTSLSQLMSGCTKKGFYNRSGLVHLGQHIATIVHYHTLGKNNIMNAH